MDYMVTTKPFNRLMQTFSFTQGQDYIPLENGSHTATWEGAGKVVLFLKAAGFVVKESESLKLIEAVLNFFLPQLQTWDGASPVQLEVPPYRSAGIAA